MKLNQQGKEALAEKIAQVVEGKPGFIIVGNKEDEKISSTMILKDVSNGELSVAIIQILGRSFAESKPDKI